MALKGSHPEYTTSGFKEILTGICDSSTIFIQQNTEKMDITCMSMKNTPVIVTQDPNQKQNQHQLDTSFEPYRTTHDFDTESTIHTPQNNDSDEYAIFTMAKRATKASDTLI